MASSTTDRRLGLTGATAIKAPVKVYTIAAIVLSGEQTVNGVPIVTGDRVLVKNQLDATTNGVYDVSTSSWTRSLDFDGTNDVVNGTLVPSYDGISTYAVFALATVNPVIGTSNITFEQVDSIALQGLLAASSGASLVGFTQSGTGAVARTLQSAIQSFVRTGDYDTLGHFATALAALTETIGVSALSLNGPLFNTAPVAQTSASYVVGAADHTIRNNVAGTVTLTLPTASANAGRMLRIITITSNTVVSNASNVVPLAGGAAGTAILAATAGKWADLESDATNWIITASN